MPQLMSFQLNKSAGCVIAGELGAYTDSRKWVCLTLANGYQDICAAQFFSKSTLNRPTPFFGRMAFWSGFIPFSLRE